MKHTRLPTYVSSFPDQEKPKSGSPRPGRGISSRLRLRDRSASRMISLRCEAQFSHAHDHFD